MNKNILSLAIAVLATGFAQNSLAATATPVTGAALPSYPAAGTANVVTLNLAGSSAQDKGIINILLSDICQAGTLKIFKDSYATTANPNGTNSTSNWGGRWASYVCTTGTTNQAGGTVPTALQNKTFVINKRSAGGSAYALGPIISNPLTNSTPFAVNFLDVQAALSDAATIPVYSFTDTVSGKSVPTYGVYGAEPIPSLGGGLAAGNHTKQVIPDAGVADTNPGLFSGSENIVPEFNGKGVDPSDVATLHVTSAAAFTFTVPVSLGLFNALQAAQGLTVSPEYGSALGKDDYTPTLSTTQVAAIISGGVTTWDSLNFKNGNLVTAASAAGVSVPTDTMVHYLRRVPGSGTGAQQYARFLNYPAVANAAAPAADNKSFGGPAVSFLLETVDEETAFDDLANGTSTTTAYLSDGSIDTTVAGVNNGVKAWAVGQLSADKNANLTGAYAHAYRHIKIDGYAPTLQNVFDGNYKDWAQSSWVYNASWPAKTSTASQALLTYLTQQATQATILNKANAKQYFGDQSGNNVGYLGLVDNNGGVTPATLNVTAPVIPYTYPGGDNGAVPVPAQGAVLNFSR